MHKRQKKTVYRIGICKNAPKGKQNDDEHVCKEVNDDYDVGYGREAYGNTEKPAKPYCSTYDKDANDDKEDEVAAQITKTNRRQQESR